MNVIHASGVPEVVTVSGFAAPSGRYVPLITCTVQPGLTALAARFSVLKGALSVRP